MENIRIKVNGQEERKSVITALVESGYRVHIEYECINAPLIFPGMQSFNHEYLDLANNIETNIYVVADEVKFDGNKQSEN